MQQFLHTKKSFLCQVYNHDQATWTPYTSLITHRWGHNAVTLNSSLNVIGGRFAGGKQFERIVPYAHLRERSQHGPILLQVRFQKNKVLNLSYT